MEKDKASRLSLTKTLLTYTVGLPINFDFTEEDEKRYARLQTETFEKADPDWEEHLLEFMGLFKD